MTRDVSALLEREKDVLRLLLVGNDAKSIARHLNLSTHVVNERLRDARRKLGVGSSREAARLLAQAEADTPKKFGDKDFGYPQPVETVTDAKAQPGQKLAQTGINKGILVMIFSATMLASAAFLFSMNNLLFRLETLPLHHRMQTDCMPVRVKQMAEVDRLPMMEWACTYPKMAVLHGIM